VPQPRVAFIFNGDGVEETFGTRDNGVIVFPWMLFNPNFHRQLLVSVLSYSQLKFGKRRVFGNRQNGDRGLSYIG
jgi:hypothetical protein